jgi:predicted RNA-binding protein YlxR (DUF448 family)
VSKKPQRRKHVPQRTCVGCHTVLPKRSLIRIVRSAQGVRVDPTGKASGRGAYLHDNKSCWERGLKGALSHALKIELTDQDREHLLEYMSILRDETLPEKDQTDEQS